MADQRYPDFISVVGVQWDPLDKINGGKTFGGLPIWASQHKCGNHPWCSSASNTRSRGRHVFSMLLPSRYVDLKLSRRVVEHGASAAKARECA